MKKNILLIAIFALCSSLAISFSVFSQDTEENASYQEVSTEDTTVANTEESTDVSSEEGAVKDGSSEEQGPEKKSFHQILKQKFIEGGPTFMGITAICLVLGLAIAIERILYLSLSTVNPKKLLKSVEQKIKSGDVEGAKKLCQNTKGPVASIIQEGLSKVGQGVETIEKSVVSLGSVQMSLLEKGVSWISLFIALAPMLGFMGTVIGMIGAFDAIQEAGDISPSLVAGGIKVALLTTVLGLIVAMILQVFYNYIIAKIDSLVGQMETSTIEFMDIIVENNIK